MPSSYLVDTSFLYTLFDSEDEKHELSLKFLKSAQKVGSQFLFPEIILGEATFLFRRSGGVPAVTGFLSAFLIMEPTILSLEFTDISRAGVIMNNYATANLDFVDCCIMALSERLGITKVCTFDRRDFSMFRPNHTEFLELVPN